jgi:hypothetical protein
LALPVREPGSLSDDVDIVLSLRMTGMKSDSEFDYGIDLERLFLSGGVKFCPAAVVLPFSPRDKVAPKGPVEGAACADASFLPSRPSSPGYRSGADRGRAICLDPSFSIVRRSLAGIEMKVATTPAHW